MVMPETPSDTVHRQEGYTAAIAKGKEVGMERRHIQRKQAFLGFEIEALRTLLERSRWISCLGWLLIELAMATLFVAVLFWLGLL